MPVLKSSHSLKAWEKHLTHAASHEKATSDEARSAIPTSLNSKFKTTPTYRLAMYPTLCWQKYSRNWKTGWYRRQRR